MFHDSRRESDPLTFYVVLVQRRMRAKRFMFQKLGPVLFSRKRGLPANFGEITFGTDVERKHYMVISDTTSVGLLTTFMLLHWCMTKPEVIVSISGGAQDFRLAPRVQNLIDSGIVAAASSARAVFFTPGSNAGVCKMVASTLHAHEVKADCVGVIALACIKENERLLAQQQPGVAGEVVYPTYVLRESQRAAPHMCPHTCIHTMALRIFI